jgi:hypothetical protein
MINTSTQSGVAITARTQGSLCGTLPSRQVCGVDRSAAEFGDRCIALVADDEDAGYGSDDVVGDGSSPLIFSSAV